MTKSGENKDTKFLYWLPKREPNSLKNVNIDPILSSLENKGLLTYCFEEGHTVSEPDEVVFNVGFRFETSKNFDWWDWKYFSNLDIQDSRAFNLNGFKKFISEKILKRDHLLDDEYGCISYRMMDYFNNKYGHYPIK